jgi:diguanylate cyclase (GGDEF)-like protein/PAS domain S-box-containing protein
MPVENAGKDPAGSPEERFQLSTAVMDLLLDAICVVDARGCFVYISGACEKIFGYTPAELEGRAMMDLVHPDDREATLATARAVMQGRLTNHFENRYIRKDGSVVHILWSANWSEKDQLRVAVAHDISDRKHTEAMQAAVYAISEAAANAANLPALFRHIHQIIGGLLPASVFCIALHDGQANEISFPYCANRQGAEDPVPGSDTRALANAVIHSGQPIRLRAQDPASGRSNPLGITDRSLDWLAVPLTTSTGVQGALVIQNRHGAPSYSAKDQQLLHYISTQIATAIQRARMHAQLEFLSRYDPLTRLPNRSLLSDRIATALARARRDKGRVALLYLDLDKFKQVNDTHGHAVGDQLLQAVAARISGCIRESDTVSRIGGDEFVILLETLDQPLQAHAVANKIREAFHQPLQLDVLGLAIVPSIGIALYPDDGDAEQHLLERADRAMYQAKRDGGSAHDRALGQAPAELAGGQTEVDQEGRLR